MLFTKRDLKFVKKIALTAPEPESSESDDKAENSKRNEKACQ